MNKQTYSCPVCKEDIIIPDQCLSGTGDKECRCSYCMNELNIEYDVVYEYGIWDDLTKLHLIEGIH